MVGYTQQPTPSQGPPTNKKKSPWGDAGIAEIHEDLLSMPHTPQGIQKLQEYAQGDYPDPIPTLAGMVINNRNSILDASKQPPTSTVAQQNYEQAMASVQAPQGPQVAGIGGGGGMPIDPNMISGQTARGIGNPDMMPRPQPRGSGVAQLPARQMVAGGGLISLAGGGQVIPFVNTGQVPSSRWWDSARGYDRSSPEYRELLERKRKAQEQKLAGIGPFFTETIPNTIGQYMPSQESVDQFGRKLVGGMASTLTAPKRAYDFVREEITPTVGLPGVATWDLPELSRESIEEAVAPISDPSFITKDVPEYWKKQFEAFQEGKPMRMGKDALGVAKAPFKAVAPKELTAYFDKEKERKAKRDASAKATKEARARGELGGLRDLSTEEAAKAGSQSAIAELKARKPSPAKKPPPAKKPKEQGAAIEKEVTNQFGENNSKKDTSRFNEFLIRLGVGTMAAKNAHGLMDAVAQSAGPAFESYTKAKQQDKENILEETKLDIQRSQVDAIRDYNIGRLEAGSRLSAKDLIDLREKWPSTSR